MALFYFRVLDKDGGGASESAHEFASLADAKAEARRALGEMAADGLPGEALNMMSVEVLDAQKQSLIEVRLLIEELPKGLS
ncbi:hypothetical protein BJF93_23870 [Xaviernesmea oryzae]|uniref:DUF6894 domain-containing protein n=1 Tax=Xaviernesmea oryzae TaxID=464029 RepID=A0A1Q9B2Z6_9HYPH|nr:hypothetical protein [Xaviernesmea oryzae]OLP62390.1 hypothetical protein BJF93_23870 [Xaviernesmea oryzae]SEL99131.1 hypothetical protein SAMN04487976_116110 [Xaviernesmea oryzae]